MKFHTQKVQCVIGSREKEEELLRELTLVRWEKRGSMLLTGGKRNKAGDFGAGGEQASRVLGGASPVSGRNLYQ